jgi:hypothetical protein
LGLARRAVQADTDVKLMMRLSASASRWPRQYFDAALIVLKWPLQVDRDDAVPLLLRHVEDHAVAEDAGRG